MIWVWVFVSFLLPFVELICDPRDKYACSQRGECYVNDTISKDYGECLCDEFYEGEDCEIFHCGEFVKYDPEVCNGRGICISHDNCSCVYWATNPLCETRLCDGIPENSTGLICHGNGICGDNDTCICTLDFEGIFCDERIMSWMWDNRIIVPVAISVFWYMISIFVCLCALDLYYVIKSRERKRGIVSRTIIIRDSKRGEQLLNELEVSLFRTDSYSSESTDDLDDLYAEFDTKKTPSDYGLSVTTTTSSDDGEEIESEEDLVTTETGEDTSSSGIIEEEEEISGTTSSDGS